MKLLRSILLEGPDGAGKTSLYDRMSSPVHLGGWGLRATGNDGRNPDTAAEAWQRLAMFAALSPCVRDRSVCVSELVYAPAMQREMIVNPVESRKYLEAYSPFLIYCRPPIEEIRKVKVKAKAHKPPEFAEEVEALREQIVTGYDLLIPDLVLNCSLDHVRYDWTKDPDASILREVLIGTNVCAA